jgi:hypothetical protein
MELNPQWFVAAFGLPSVTALGCVTAYVYSEQKEIESSHQFLRRFFPDRSDAFYFRVDFFMTAVVGTCIGQILYQPRNTYQALAAGIGWTAAFSIAKIEKRRQATGSERRTTASGERERESKK